MNRRIALVAAALAVALGALPLMAQQGSGGGFDQGPGQRMGGPGRGRGPGGPGGPMAVLPGLNQVDLTDAQRDQVKGIMDQERQSGDPGEKVREAEQALHAAVLADTPNPQAIDAAKGALNAAHVAELDHRVELMQKIVQVLTPAQRQQLAQWQGPGRRGGL